MPLMQPFRHIFLELLLVRLVLVPAPESPALPAIDQELVDVDLLGRRRHR